MHEMHDGWPHDSEVTQRERLPRVLAFGLSAQGIAGRSANFWFERGIRMEDFRIDTMPRRIARVGDLLSPMLNEKKRVDLSALLK